jgi:hypothetical protein
LSQTPSSSHCRNRRQQVEGEGNSSGKNRHAAPVWRIHSNNAVPLHPQQSPSQRDSSIR